MAKLFESSHREGKRKDKVAPVTRIHALKMYEGVEIIHHFILHIDTWYR
jgi:hypothetical protein